MNRFIKIFSLLLISSFLQAQVEEDPSFKEYEDKVPGSLMVEFGWAYDSEYPPGMELDWWRSRTFNLYYMYDIRLGSDKLSLNPGFGVGIDNYSFRENIYVVKGEDSLFGQIVDLDAERFLRIETVIQQKLETPKSIRFISISRLRSGLGPIALISPSDLL